MSIIVKDIVYKHPNREMLFENVSFSLADGQKASLIGHNGVGKSTLLQILSGELAPSAGSLSMSGSLYFVPQHFGQFNNLTVAEVLGVDKKITALRAILAGSVSEKDFQALDDDWEIEEKVRRELTFWGLRNLSLTSGLSELSGGEKTKVFLAGINLSAPSVIIMDEPTNHLDRESREKLYSLISRSNSTILVVSHDRELLNLMDITLELSSAGVQRYGGNYDFYKPMKEEHLTSLRNKIEVKEKLINKAAKTAKEARERKEKMDARGEKKQKKAGVPKIAMGNLKDGAEKSASKLQDIHSVKIDKIKLEVRELKDEVRKSNNMKIALHDSDLHKGKILIEADNINFKYPSSDDLWENPLSFKILSGDRIRLEGENGSGKTSLIRIVLGELLPTDGSLHRVPFRSIYVDQEYSLIDNSLTVISQLEKYNIRNLPDYELKTELHRFLFPSHTWDKLCGSLSGGEKMRLMLCCLLVSNDTPELFILDEPTNNLDINSMEILTLVLKNFNGTILVISHDNYFIQEIGVDASIVLSRRAPRNCVND